MAKRVEVTKEARRPGKNVAPSEPSVSHPLMALREQMDHLFDDFMSDWRLPSLSRDLFTFEPPHTPPWGRGVDVKFDVSETDDAIQIAAELPGIEEKDIDLTYSDGVLTVRGEKKAESETKERDYVVSERRYGSFARSMRLPDTIDAAKIKAKFDKGVLTVTLPKLAEAKAKKKKIAISKG